MPSSIYTKLLAVQKELQPIKKDKENPYFKSRYFDINSLVAEIKPLFNKHGLVVTQPLTGNAVSTIITDVEGDSFVTSSINLPDISDPQKLGSAITYFRRYTLQSLLFLEGEDDDANLAAGNVAKSEKGPVAPKTRFSAKRIENTVPDTQSAFNAAQQAIQDTIGPVGLNALEGQVRESKFLTDSQKDKLYDQIDAKRQ